jgi:hypothetical protein
MVKGNNHKLLLKPFRILARNLHSRKPEKCNLTPRSVRLQAEEDAIKKGKEQNSLRKMTESSLTSRDTLYRSAWSSLL